MNDYYNCVRRFVVSDPELPDSLYLTPTFNKYPLYILLHIVIDINVNICLCTAHKKHHFTRMKRFFNQHPINI